MTDSATADHPVPDRRSRRALLGAGLGAALAMVGSRAASATTDEPDEDTGDGDTTDTTVAIEPISAPVDEGEPSGPDLETARFVIGAELAARDLYQAAVDEGADDEVYGLLAKQHEAYAQRIAGLTGIPADTPAMPLYESAVGEFRNDDPIEASITLENTMAATHVELLAAIKHATIAGAVASIAAMESRHATALVAKAGNGDDLDALFTNDAAPLSPGA